MEVFERFRDSLEWLHPVAEAYEHLRKEQKKTKKYQRQLARVSAVGRSLRTEIEELKGEIKKLQSSDARKGQERDLVRKECVSARKTIVELQGKVGKLQSSDASMSQERDLLRKECVSARIEIVQLQREVRKLQSCDTCNEVNLLRKKYVAALNEIKELKLQRGDS